MTNNMIRKSLAVSAGLSLAAVGLVAAPAQAAPTSLSIKPVAGDQSDTQNSVLGAQFLVATTAVGAANTDDIEYYITGADEADFADVVFADETSLSALTQLDSDSTNSGKLANGNSGQESLLGDEAADPVPATSATDLNIDQDWTAGEFNVLALELDTTAVTSTTTITITPFVDNQVNNGVPDDDELTGNTLSITFHKASEVTATTTLDAFVAGANKDTMTANVVLDNNINMASTADAAEVTFVEDGSSIGTADQAAFWNVADEAYTATSDASSTISETSVYGASAKVLGASSAGDTDLESALTGQVDTLGALAVSDSPYYYDDTDSDDVLRATSTGGSGSFTVSSTVTALEAESKLTGNFSGHTVYFDIFENADGDLGDASVTSGGENLTDSTSGADKVTVAATTNASGVASITINYTDLKDGDKFKVDPYAYGADDVATGGAEIEFTGMDSVATNLYPVDHVGGTTMLGTTSQAGTDPIAAVDAGETISIRYRVTDQFGSTPEGEFRLNATLDGGTGDQSDDVIFDSNGFATLSFDDNSTSDNTRELTTLDLDIRNSDGVAWDDVTPANSAKAFAYADTDLKNPGRVTLSSSQNDSQELDSIDIRDTSLVSDVDTRFGVDAGTVQSTKGTLADSVLDGVVYGTDGAVRPGAVVTLSAPDVMFVQYDGTVGNDDEGEVYSYGSITVVADASGRYDNIAYFSNVAGARTITATSGSVTDTVDVVFDGVGHSSGAEWQVTAPDTAEPGSTFSVTAKLVDKYGNAVDSQEDQTDITYDGPGLVVGDLPTETGADGTLKFSVLLGQNDSGSATVVFDEYGADNETGTSVTSGVRDNVDNITASVTITVGEVVGDYGTQKAWTVNQDDGTAKVYVKFPEIDGKLRILHQTGGSGSYDSVYSKTTTSETMDGLRIVEGVGTYVVRTIDLADGTNRIRVSVDGEDIEVNGKDRPARYNE